jgi:hypothetical protein
MYVLIYKGGCVVVRMRMFHVSGNVDRLFVCHDGSVGGVVIVEEE